MVLTKSKKFAFIMGIIVAFFNAYPSENKGIFAWFSQWFYAPSQENEKMREQFEALKQQATEYITKSINTIDSDPSDENSEESTRNQPLTFIISIGLAVDKLNENTIDTGITHDIFDRTVFNLGLRLIKKLNLAQLICMTVLFENSNFINAIKKDLKSTYSRPFRELLKKYNKESKILSYAFPLGITIGSGMRELISYRKRDFEHSTILAEGLPFTIAALGGFFLFAHGMARLTTSLINYIGGVPHPDKLSEHFINHLDKIHQTVLNQIKNKQQSRRTFDIEVLEAQEIFKKELLL